MSVCTAARESGYGANTLHEDWRDTDHVNYDDFSQAHLPHMDKVNGLLMSLNLEAVKR